jgi:predicted ATP-dependent serine protease
VQNGLPWLGFPVVKGDCLYLALEDSPRRLSDRIKKLKLDKLQEYPTINIEAPIIGKGLEESIRNWIETVKNPRLVVVDTLARVKPMLGKTSGTLYDLDNQLLNNLQKLATSSGITIVIVSHLGKEKKDYDWDRIQGSAGMQGMSDAMWLLDRGDNSNSAFIILTTD